MPTQGPSRELNVQQIILDEVRAVRTDMNTRLDKLVTTEAFAAEQRRVDQQFTNLGQDIVDERVARGLALAAESTTRREADDAETKSRKDADDAIRATAARSAFLWRWVTTGVVVPVVISVLAFWLSRGTP